MQFRYIKDRGSMTEYTYEFFHNDTLDASQYFHGWTGLTDNTGTGDRVWYFDGPNRLYAEQRRGRGYVVKSQTNYTWAVSPSQREYIAQTTSIINDPGGTLSTQQQQTVDYSGTGR